MKAKLIKKKDGWYNLYQDNIGIGSTHSELQGYKLSVKNCQAIENGYDLDELYGEVDESIDYHEFDFTSFRLGFQKALELLGDKKFSEQDVLTVVMYVLNELVLIDGFDKNYLFPENVHYETTSKCKSLQQTEWEVEIVTFTENDLKSVNEDWGKLDKPKLDADGCLILKRI